MNSRMVLLLAVALGIVAAASASDAGQAAKVPRVGVLISGSPSTHKGNIDAFRQGLRDLGHIEGQKILIEYRYAEGKVERFPDLAAELVRLKPDVLVTAGLPGTRALRDATSTTPIVMAAIGDAIASGLVQSLAWPGGNITGLSFLAPELSGKRLELLKELLPAASRVAALWHPASVRASLDATLAASKPLGLKIQVLEVRSASEFDGAFASAKTGRAEALIVLPSPILLTHRRPLVELAAKHRLPGMYEFREFVEEGGLMSYAASLPDLYRRAATYVDKILKGAKPTDLPVEQPTRFELVINMKTAKALGITFPPSILIRADQLLQ